LDGLPLALELVAAYAKALTPRDMLRRLNARFQLLAGGAQDLPQRQQTIRSAIDWSYNLLAPASQTLFSRLSVFAGGFTLETAETVCNPDRDLDVFEGIASLLNHSLLRYESPARLGMLETIQEYALEKLAERGELDTLRRDHALAFAGLAAEAGPQLYSSQGDDWLNRIEAEYDNLRQALAWLQDTPELRPVAWQCMIDLVWMSYRRGYLNEARQWLENAVQQSKTIGNEPLRGFLLVQAGAIAMWQSDLDTAAQLMEEGIAILRRAEEPSMLAFGLFTRGVLSVNRDEPERAKPYLQEALTLSEQLGQDWFQAMSHLHLGNVALSQELIPQATARMETALRLGKELGARWIIASALNNFGEIARYQKQYQQAEKYYLETKDLFESVESFPDVARAYHSLGYVALARGDPAEARALFERSMELHQKLGVKRGVIEAVCGLAALLADQGQAGLFVRVFGAVESQFTTLAGNLWPADRAEVERRLEAARQQLGENAFTAALESGKSIDLKDAITLVREKNGIRK
jgi:tetratricopeptide (TPR) repeat protein